MGYSLQIFFFITIEEACFPGNYNTTPCDLSNTVVEITSTTIKEFFRTQSLNFHISQPRNVFNTMACNVFKQGKKK